MTNYKDCYNLSNLLHLKLLNRLKKSQIAYSHYCQHFAVLTMANLMVRDKWPNFLGTFGNYWIISAMIMSKQLSSTLTSLKRYFMAWHHQYLVDLKSKLSFIFELLANNKEATKVKSHQNDAFYVFYFRFIIAINMDNCHS